jgi:DNA-directed RNA polymerase specialized sigma subunit
MMYNKYKYQQAVNELKALGYKLKTLERMRVRMEELNTAKYSIGGGIVSSLGGSHQEDKIGAMIAKSEELTREYDKLYAQCVPMLAALEALSDEERRVLEMCFVHRRYGWDTRACEILHLSRRRVYYIKDAALQKYAEIRGYKAEGAV